VRGGGGVRRGDEGCGGVRKGARYSDSRCEVVLVVLIGSVGTDLAPFWDIAEGTAKTSSGAILDSISEFFGCFYPTKVLELL
jgi:hypothetical protein